VDDTPEAPTVKKSPDGLSVAISTDFVDDPDQVVQSFIYATSRGMSGYKTAEQVSDWTDV
jgi:hypothetical protein